MAQVPDRILSWLWSIAQPYGQPRLVYNDAVAALSRYPSLKPRTAVYTHEDGRTVLLLCLFGTVSTTTGLVQPGYEIEIWLPHRYGEPHQPIMPYIKPIAAGNSGGESMVIQPGQHVAMDGRIYHPYLRDWNIHERSNVVTFVSIMQSILSRESPVTRKRPTGPSLPSKSPIVTSSELARPFGQDRPPPLPAKSSASAGPSHDYDQGNSVLLSDTSQVGGFKQQRTPSRYAAPAPLPPTHLPNHIAKTSAQAIREPSALMLQRNVSPSVSQRPSSQQGSPARMQHGHVFSPHPGAYLMAPASMSVPEATSQYHHGGDMYASNGPLQSSSTGNMNSARTQPIKRPMVDLLTDPFDITLNNTTAHVPAPPIPLNPEKEHLLQALSERLVEQANAKVRQARDAVISLSAQQRALLEAHSRLQAELQQLNNLDAVLNSNERILRQSMVECQRVIESSRQTARPDIDSILVAPSIAAQQLWTVCADEAGIKQAMWCLHRAVNAGRISGTDFIRMTRSLARERFLKMALARKIGKGLGLEA